MSDEWVSTGDLTVPDEINVAVGKLALAFAAVHTGLSILLHDARATKKSFQQLCGLGFEPTLDKVERLLQEKELLPLVPIERLRELSKARNPRGTPQNRPVGDASKPAS
jgi:hypothetical protein